MPSRNFRLAAVPVWAVAASVLRSLMIAALFVAVAGTTAAAAAEADKSEDMIREGLDLRRTGNDQKAYHLFRKANEMSHSPRSAGQLGFCEQALGRWADAETHLAEALLVPTDPWIKKNRPSIEQALMLIKAHIARVEVVGDPVGATVTINGGVVGQLPLADPVRVSAGEIEVQLRAPGFARASKTVRVEGGQYYKVPLSLEKETAASATPAAAAAAAQSARVVAPTASAPPAPPASSAPTENASSDDTADSDSASPSSAGRRSLKFISWAVAAGAAGVGLYGYVHNLSLVNEFDTGCALDKGQPRLNDQMTPGYTTNRCVSLKTRYESASTLSLVGFAGAAVFIGVGVAFWLTEPSAEEGRTALWSCAPGFASNGHASVACAIRF